MVLKHSGTKHLHPSFGDFTVQQCKLIQMEQTCGICPARLHLYLDYIESEFCIIEELDPVLHICPSVDGL